MTIKSSSGKSYKILAIIPARGGSKGIKNKNIKKVGDIPLIGHTARLLSSIKYIDKSIVSTDSKKIKKISENYGVSVPFLRPTNLSGDNVPDIPVLQHGLNECERIYKTKFDVILMLQPTSPMRSKSIILNAIKKLVEEKLDSVWSVSKVDSKFHPLKILKITNKGYLDFYLSEGANIINRQMLDNTFQRNGLVYAFKRKSIIEGKILPKKSGYLIVDKFIINIDNYKELKDADEFFKCS
tara:strand:- start:396 stop:1115 length:720 start_codon:yes stop_codon:yes gene_type:complete